MVRSPVASLAWPGDASCHGRDGRTPRSPALGPPRGPRPRPWAPNGSTAASIITTIVEWFGPWAIVGVMLVIFAETGLLVGFFLPGDSLLFTLGMFVGTGAVGVHIWVAAPLVWLAAIIGNQTGYAIGRKAGPAIFNRPDSRLFKKEYVDRTAAFFERHGGKAVTLAQFVPIVRTFTPVMAASARCTTATSSSSMRSARPSGPSPSPGSATSWAASPGFRRTSTP